MTTTEGLSLQFGLTRAIPESADAAWGARLIAPNDLVWDRQDLATRNEAAKLALVRWLNGEPEGTGAIKKMREALTSLYHVMGQNQEVRTLYEDDHGVIVGSTNASYGYVYVAGWLKPDVPRVAYEVRRVPITAKRWEEVYGWSAEEAAKMGGSGSEVRVYVIDRDGKRDLAHHVKHSPTGFEYGYGGSGPHELARCIVIDLLDLDPSGDAWDDFPANYGRLVHSGPLGDPKHKDEPLTIHAIDVLEALK